MKAAVVPAVSSSWQIKDVPQPQPREKDGRETMWLAETKGEMRTNVPLKNGSAELWCDKMSTTRYGQWRYLFAQQVKLEKALSKGVATFAEVASDLAG